jgi:hypothetical protein
VLVAVAPTVAIAVLMLPAAVAIVATPSVAANTALLAEMDHALPMACSSAGTAGGVKQI